MSYLVLIKLQCFLMFQGTGVKFGNIRYVVAYMVTPVCDHMLPTGVSENWNIHSISYIKVIQPIPSHIQN